MSSAHNGGLPSLAGFLLLRTCVESSKAISTCRMSCNLRLQIQLLHIRTHSVITWDCWSTFSWIDELPHYKPMTFTFPEFVYPWLLKLCKPWIIPSKVGLCPSSWFWCIFFTVHIHRAYEPSSLFLLGLIPVEDPWGQVGSQVDVCVWVCIDVGMLEINLKHISSLLATFVVVLVGLKTVVFTGS